MSKQISIITLNAKNIKGNLAYAQSLAAKYDIICLQEHWLFSFELKFLESISKDHSIHAKAVDMNNPLPPLQVPRGYGGTAIVYKNNWNIKSVKHADGQERINVLELETNPKICIINVYLPSRGNNTKEKFKATLDEVEEILRKFNDTYLVLLCGDMNASLKRTPENEHDKIFKAFVKRNELYTTQEGIPTFTHPNGEDKYEIDYILTNNIGKKTAMKTVLNIYDPLNTSDHIAISTKVSIGYGIKQKKDKVIQSKKKNGTCVIFKLTK